MLTDFELFNRYPQLEKSVPRKNLGMWPTPLQELDNLSGHLEKKILVKRDDLSGKVYGGNKVRKLEFILADVTGRGKKSVITVGGLGSHHVLAVAALGRELGLETAGLFFCQPVNDHVRKNLLLEHRFGTRMYFSGDYPGVIRDFIRYYFAIWAREKRTPYFLIPGGSTVRSTLGYVNAVMEMQAQLRDKGLPDPDAIFVAAGSGGTTAGLLAGTVLAGMDTVIRGIQVVPSFVLSHSGVVKLARKTLGFLSARGVTVDFKRKDLSERLFLERGYLGDGYGFSTHAADGAIGLFKDYEDITLEGCYTGKAAAGLIDYCRNCGEEDGERPVIFVNTYSSTHIQPDDTEFESGKESLPADFLWCLEGGTCGRRCTLKRMNRTFCETGECGSRR